jgi:nucleotide-binding universal stress UspA family protein
MFSKILLPLDGSTNAEKISDWSEGLARSFDASITLLMVVDPEKVPREDFGSGPDRPVRRATPMDQPAGVSEKSGGIAIVDGVSMAGEGVRRTGSYGVGTQVVERATQDADKYVAGVASEFLSKGFSVNAMTTVGTPEVEILRIADEEDIELISMATHRGSSIARGILGSVTDRVLRSSIVPVLTVRPGTPAGFGESGVPRALVVPLDGSAVSQQAIDPAIQIAKATGAEIVFMQAIRQLVGSGIDYHYDPTPDVEACLDYLEQFANRAKEQGVNARSHVLIGSAAIKIIEEVQEFEGGLVVMSTHGSSGLPRWMVGSVADKVIRASRRPVLVIPPYFDM